MEGRTPHASRLPSLLSGRTPGCVLYPRWEVTYLGDPVKVKHPRGNKTQEEENNPWFLESLPSSCSHSHLGHWRWA